MKYKEDQGRHARMAAFWTLVLLALFGSNFIFEQLVQISSMRNPLGADEAGRNGWRLPVVGIDLSPAFLLCTTLFAVGVYAIHRWRSKPKVIDLLIDTEDELKKVTWPTMDDVVNTSIVVIFFVLFIAGFIAVADILLNRIVSVLILGTGGGQ